MLVEMLRVIASSLQNPVIVLLIALVCAVAVIVGMLIAEVFTERRQFKVSLPRLTDDLKHNPDTYEVVEQSGLLRRQKEGLHELLRHPDITPDARESLAVNMVSQEQSRFDNRVKITDFISKASPMLGLMGTLIPLGPGLIGIGQGETEVLSESLLTAFDTTVLGLVVAVVALAVSTIRKSWYRRYMSAFEAATEVVLERADELTPEQTREMLERHAVKEEPAKDGGLKEDASGSGSSEGEGQASVGSVETPKESAEASAAARIKTGPKHAAPKADKDGLR